MAPPEQSPVGPFFSACGQICGQGGSTHNLRAEFVAEMGVFEPLSQVLPSINLPGALCIGTQRKKRFLP